MLPIHLEDLERHHLPRFDGFFWLLDTIFGEFRDVAKPLDPIFQLDKRPEVGKPGHLTRDDVSQVMRFEEALP